MKSFVSSTTEIYNIPLAVDALVQGLGDSWKKYPHHTCLLFCESDMPQEEFVAALSQALAVTVIGTTTNAAVEGTHGLRETAIVLMMLAADDALFATALSQPIKAGDDAAIEAAAQEAAASLGEEPRLFIMFTPNQDDMVLDAFSDTINRLFPGVPLVGGVSSHRTVGDEPATIYGGHTYKDRLSLLAIAGNIAPKFFTVNVLAESVERKRLVTQAEGNVIYRVGEQRFTDYLQDMGLPLEQLATSRSWVSFMGMPLLLEHREGDERASMGRLLTSLDTVAGTGTATGNIPQGFVLSVCPIARTDIEACAHTAGEALRREVMEGEAAGGYRYSTLFMVSCYARYTLLASRKELELQALLRHLPDHIKLGGFYSHGELMPFVKQDGQCVNYAHNISMGLCVF